MYKGRIREKGLTAIRGDVDQVITASELSKHRAPVMVEFLKDDDIQEITIASANLGIVLTYTKLDAIV